MRIASSWFVAGLPAALLLLMTFWAGTFAGGAGAWGALAGHLALLLCLATSGDGWRDPLALGSTGRWLVLALLASVTISWWSSPVPRAGRLALVLLPGFLFVPRTVAACWSSPERRRLGLISISLTVSAVAIWSLISGGLLEPPALPLGHHNLLAAWLVTLLPLALLPWRDGGAGRWVAALAGLTGFTALAATGSLIAQMIAAFLVAGTAFGWILASRGRRAATLLLIAAGLLVAPQVPRLLRLGEDGSFQARLGYLEAGWQGFLERSAFGWGPGATAWTIGEFFRPRPGIHLADEVVADLHSLPLQMAYELGGSGLILATGIGLIFWFRRWLEQHQAEDLPLLFAGLFGLLAFAAVGLTGLPLSVAALPVAGMLAAGATLAATPDHSSRRPTRRTKPWLPALIGAGAAALILPLDRAHLAYDRALAAPTAEAAAAHLERAVRLDPAFPLYRARKAWLDQEIEGPRPEHAREARRAAEDAFSLAPLWLVAGVQAREAEVPWSREALLRACRLSPLGALAPFHLAAIEPPEPLAVEWGARAILADPRLLAAATWSERSRLLSAAVERAALAEGVDRGWRQRLLDRYRENLELSGSLRRLGYQVDGEGSESFSLHAFRRRPWPAELAPVELFSTPLPRIDLQPATLHGTTARQVFADDELCILGVPGDL